MEMQGNDRTRQNRIGAMFFFGFIGTIFAANWFITHVGTVCLPNGPCLIPVGFGLTAPSGVLWAGIAFTLRDLLQRQWGTKATALAIVIGAGFSAYLSPALAFASGAAFLFSEFADMAVYTPLQRRWFFLAVILSNTAGLIVDSALFLYLAFGSLKYLSGQVVGKAWMTVLALPILYYLRRRGSQEKDEWSI